MNKVLLIGRLTKDPAVRYKDEMAVANFTLAVDRPKMNGKEATSDFPSCVAFGKTAETIEKYLGKGRRIGVEGRIQTSNYTDKDGNKVYRTDVVVERFEFLDSKSEGKPSNSSPVDTGSPVPGFEQITTEDIPF